MPAGGRNGIICHFIIKEYRCTDTSESNDETGGEIMASKGVGTGKNSNSRQGTKNLKPVTSRTKEEAREISRKGGIKSGEARRAKRDAKKAAEVVLYETLISTKGKQALKRNGIELNTKEDLYGMAGLMAGLLANGMKGDTGSAKLLLELAGVFEDDAESSEEKHTGVVMIPPRGDETDDK